MCDIKPPLCQQSSALFHVALTHQDYRKLPSSTGLTSPQRPRWFINTQVRPCLSFLRVRASPYHDHVHTITPPTPYFASSQPLHLSHPTALERLLFPLHHLLLCLLQILLKCPDHPKIAGLPPPLATLSVLLHWFILLLSIYQYLTDIYFICLSG